MKKYFAYIHLTDSIHSILKKLQTMAFYCPADVIDLLACAEQDGYPKFVGPIEAVCLTPAMFGFKQPVPYWQLNTAVLENGFEYLPLQAALLLRKELPHDWKVICGMQDLQDLSGYGLTLVYDFSTEGAGIYTEYSGIWDKDIVVDPTMQVLFKLSSEQVLLLKNNKSLFLNP